MYAKINGTTVVEYPYSIQKLKAENPHTSFPSNLSNEDLAGFNVVFINPSKEPQFNYLTHKVVEGAPSILGGSWVQRWKVEPLTPTEQQLVFNEVQKSIVASVQERLDTFAQTRNYDSILSACTYATSAVPKFQQEGQYCVNARDQTWSAMYAVMAAVQAGTRPMPSGFADVVSELPVLAWPA